VPYLLQAAFGRATRRVHASIFGAAFPLVVEPHVFATAGRLSEDYAGGFWSSTP
jgi:hypothetical protein